jgi:hydroxyacylglutathione hydrolase
MIATLNRIAALPSNTYIYCAHEYTLANLRFAHIAEPENNDIKERLANTILLRQQNLPTVPSLLSIELATNPFLRTETTKLHHTIDAYSDIKTTDSVTRFTYLRAWKDKLDATDILEII